MNTGIYVGTSPETVIEISKHILKILEARADQETIRKALDVLIKATKSPDYSTINNCVVTMPQETKISETDDMEEKLDE